MIELNTDPTRSELNWFGVLLGLFLGLAGALARFRFDAPEAARWIWIAALVLTAVYYAVPPLRRPVWIVWMAAAFPIGWTISHVILALTWYLVVTPVGLLIRLTGRDLLRRKIDRAGASYWVEHDPHGDPKRYFRQF